MNFVVALSSAAEGGGGMSSVTGAMTDVFTLVGTVITQITSQPILLFLLAAGFIPVGIRIFKSLKQASGN